MCSAVRTAGRKGIRVSDSASSVSDTTALATYAINSYRYLRIAIVVVLLALLSSVVLERAHAQGCFEESISAYYYTPVHSIFIGALVALGVCLIAIRGSTDVEDVLLNVAGVFAPIVAFVPTARPTQICTKNVYTGNNTVAYINNNLGALGIALVLTVAIAYATIFRAGKHRRHAHKVSKHAVWGFVLSVALLAFGAGWYSLSRSTFLDHAHGGGAAVLFILVGVVVIINALSSPNEKYKRGYQIVASAMVLGCITIVVVGKLDSKWRHETLWLELLELVLLLVYWTMQTAELWDPGVPTGDERIRRRNSARSSAPGRAVAKVVRFKQ
jgi:hypothetical protein